MTSEGFAAENARSRDGVTMLCSIRRAASQPAAPPPSGKSGVCRGFGIGSWSRTLPFDVLWVEKPGGAAPDDEPWA